MSGQEMEYIMTMEKMSNILAYSSPNLTQTSILSYYCRNTNSYQQSRTIDVSYVKKNQALRDSAFCESHQSWERELCLASRQRNGGSWTRKNTKNVTASGVYKFLGIHLDEFLSFDILTAL